MIGLSDHTQAEVIRVNREFNAQFIHLHPSEEYYKKGWQYTLDNVSPKARKELLRIEKNPSI